MGMIFSQSEIDERKKREQQIKQQIRPSTVDNTFIQTVKRQLFAYQKRKNELNKIMDDNLSRYSDSVAEEENGRIKEQKIAAYNETRQSIFDVWNRVRTLSAKANYADKSQYIKSDIDFIRDVPLSASELQGIIDGYQQNGNYLMLKWVKQHISQFDGKDKPNPYNGVVIKMPEDILRVYKQYFDSALALVENIKEEKYTTDNPSELAAFADANFGTLASVIGSGSDLESFSRKSVPEADMHVFDAVKLKDPTVNAYIA